MKKSLIYILSILILISMVNGIEKIESLSETGTWVAVGLNLDTRYVCQRFKIGTTNINQTYSATVLSGYTKRETNLPTDDFYMKLYRNNQGTNQPETLLQECNVSRTVITSNSVPAWFNCSITAVQLNISEMYSLCYYSQTSNSAGYAWHIYLNTSDRYPGMNYGSHASDPTLISSVAGQDTPFQVWGAHEEPAILRDPITLAIDKNITDIFNIWLNVSCTGNCTNGRYYFYKDNMLQANITSNNYNFTSLTNSTQYLMNVTFILNDDYFNTTSRNFTTNQTKQVTEPLVNNTALEGIYEKIKVMESDFKMIIVTLVILILMALGYWMIQTGNPEHGYTLMIISVPLDIYMIVNYWEENTYLGVVYLLLILFVAGSLFITGRRNKSNV